MTQFEHLYCQWLDEVAAVQERCEYALAAVLHYEEAGEIVPGPVSQEFREAHVALVAATGAWPLPQSEFRPLAIPA